LIYEPEAIGYVLLGHLPLLIILTLNVIYVGQLHWKYVVFGSLIWLCYLTGLYLWNPSMFNNYPYIYPTIFQLTGAGFSIALIAWILVWQRSQMKLRISKSHHKQGKKRSK
jgi:hypothetical protein